MGGSGMCPHLGRSARLAVPALVGHVVEFERRFEAREVEGAEAAAVAAEEVAFPAASVTEVVVELLAQAGWSSAPVLCYRKEMLTKKDDSPSMVADAFSCPDAVAIERRARALPPLAGLCSSV